VSIAIRPVPRRIPCPAWALAVGAAWLGGIAVLSWLAQSSPDPPVLCHFRRITGHPCPTCGTTRAGIALTEGRLVDALAFNPFMCTVGVVALGWLVLRLGFGRAIVLSGGHRAGFWITTGLLLAANWAYLIWRE